MVFCWLRPRRGTNTDVGAQKLRYYLCRMIMRICNLTSCLLGTIFLCFCSSCVSFGWRKSPDLIAEQNVLKVKQNTPEVMTGSVPQIRIFSADDAGRRGHHGLYLH